MIWTLPAASALAALVIGHPAPVVCRPVPVGTTAVTNWLSSGVPQSITVNPKTCSDLTTPIRLETADLVAGAAAIVIHEAEHYRYASPDEALTECRMRRDFDTILVAALPHSDDLERHVSGSYVAQMRAAMMAGSLTLPAEYQGAECPLPDPAP